MLRCLWRAGITRHPILAFLGGSGVWSGVGLLGRDGKKCGLSQWAEILPRKAIIRCRLGFTPFELPKVAKSEEIPRNIRYSRLCARACFWPPLCVCVLAQCVLDIVLMVACATILLKSFFQDIAGTLQFYASLGKPYKKSPYHSRLGQLGHGNCRIRRGTGC